MQAGRALKAVRQFHKLSLTEAANELGFSKSFISDLENNNKAPSLETLSRYAECFDISVSSIMLLAEVGAEDNKTLRVRLRARVSRSILRMLEFMSAETDNNAGGKTASRQGRRSSPQRS